MENGQKNGKITIQFKDIAILSIMLYIIIAVCFDGTGLSKLPLASYGIYLCACVCALYILLSGKLRLHSIYFYMLLFGAVLSISTLYSPARAALRNMYLYRFWTGVILMFLVCNTITTRKDIEKLLYASVIAGVMLALLVYAEYGFTNISKAEERLLDELSDINMLGVYCGFAIIIAAIFLITKKKFKLLYIAAIVVMTPFLMFTGSRKAVLLVVVGLLTFMFYYSKDGKILKRLFAIAAVLAVVVILIETVPAFAIIREHFEDLVNLLTGEGELDKGDINRMKYIERGWGYFLEKPIAGYGFLGSYYFFGTYTHCNYIELLMNNGIFGFVVYYVMRLAILGKVVKHGSKGDVLTAVAVTFCVGLLFCDIGVVTYYNRFLFIVTAICARAADILREERQKQWQEKQ